MGCGLGKIGRGVAWGHGNMWCTCSYIQLVVTAIGPVAREGQLVAKETTYLGLPGPDNEYTS